MQLFIVIALAVTVGLAYFALSKLEKKRKVSPSKSSRSSANSGMISYSTYFRLYKIFSENFLTGNGFKRVSLRMSELSVYNSQEVVVYSVRFYLVASSASLALIIAGAIIFRDAFSVLMIVMYSAVMRNILIDKQIDGIHLKLLKSLSKAMSSISQNYRRLNSIPDSISEAETGAEVKRAMEEIYSILTSPESDKKLTEFYATTPFKLLQTFAGVCYILNNSGDTKLSDGSSNFLQAMSMLSAEINLSIRKIAMQKSRFGFLEYLPLVPLLAIGFIENFFTSTIPGTSIIYNGFLGYISRILIISSSLLGYTVIVRINSAIPVKEDDRSMFILKLFKSNKKFGKFMTDIVPKNPSKISKKTKLLKSALSSQDLRHLYAKKVIFASLGFTIAIVFLALSVYLGKQFVYNNVKDVSLVKGTQLTSIQIKNRREVDKKFLALPKLPGDNQIKKLVARDFPKLPAYDQVSQIDRLKTKYKSYHSLYFKWYYVLVSALISLALWNAPELILIARSWMLSTESQEDVLQLETIIAILMNTTFDTLEVLYWLRRQSRVFKGALSDAYNEYPSNPLLALGRLKFKSSLEDFRRLIDKLSLTVYQVTLREAFSDLATEREHVMRIREIAQNTTLNRKRSMVSPLAMAPFALTVVLYILLPIGILGFKEFMTAIASMKH